MSTQRDELANEIADVYLSNLGAGPLAGRITQHDLADGLLAAGYRKPRVISTVEELKTVYAGCLIREEGGDLWSIDGATDRLFLIVDGADDTYDDDTLTLPAIVLYEPTA